jgi:hypothetical protein
MDAVDPPVLLLKLGLLTLSAGVTRRRFPPTGLAGPKLGDRSGT